MLIPLPGHGPQRSAGQPSHPTAAGRPVWYALAGALLVGLAQPAAAQVFQDAALQALYAAERMADLEAAAQQRLANRPDDAQAVLGLALAALAGDDSARREAAIRRAESCIKHSAQAAECHYALGVVLGVQAMSQGMLKMASSVGTVKAALLDALRLAPQWYPARSAVVEFYLQAPGMIGGSSAKAAEAARGAPQPDQARALAARVALDDEQFDAALAGLYAVQAGPLAALDPALADDVQQWITAAGFGLLAKGQAAQAKPVFERMQRDHPTQAAGYYGLGRVQHGLGAPADAVRSYEQGARLKGAAVYPFDYRLGLALQALGRSEPARAALTRFVAAGKGQAKTLDDAKKRLAQLGSPPA